MIDPEHIELLKKCLKLAKTKGTDRIQIFKNKKYKNAYVIILLEPAVKQVVRKEGTDDKISTG